jgi:hypothetical protein
MLKILPQKSGDILIAQLFRKNITLTANSILQGAVNNPLAPPLSQQLPINFTSASGSWNNGQIVYNMNIPTSSWAACVITRTPKGPIWTVNLPMMYNSGAGGFYLGATYLTNNPYPAPTGNPYP